MFAGLLLRPVAAGSLDSASVGRGGEASLRTLACCSAMASQWGSRRENTARRDWRGVAPLCGDKGAEVRIACPVALGSDVIGRARVAAVAAYKAAELANLSGRWASSRSELPGRSTTASTTSNCRVTSLSSAGGVSCRFAIGFAGWCWLARSVLQWQHLEQGRTALSPLGAASPARCLFAVRSCSPRADRDRSPSPSTTFAWFLLTVTTTRHRDLNASSPAIERRGVSCRFLSI